MQGPFDLDGIKLTLKVEWLCRNFDKDKKKCTDDFGESAESYSLLDQNGEVQFTKKFPEDSGPDIGSLDLSAVRLEGNAHQALQIATSADPSAPDTGLSSDFYALQNGKLAKFAEDIPVGAFASQEGTGQLSWKLPADDTFEVRYFTSLYYNTIKHFRFYWKEGRLDQLETNEFDVEPYFGEHPEDSAVDFYPLPDFNVQPSRVYLGPKSTIVILKAVRTASSYDTSGKKVVTEWLRITIDGKLGYIAGDADFGAIGLEMTG